MPICHWHDNAFLSPTIFQTKEIVHGLDMAMKFSSKKLMHSYSHTHTHIYIERERENNITWSANDSFPFKIAFIAANWSSNTP